jgi:APA family basic amino acid/polyamine antiporter
VTALFVLRMREPDAPRPFKALGYPFFPGLFAVAAAVIVLNALWTDLVSPFTANQPMGPSAWGLLVIALGLPLYWYFQRSKN